MKSCGSVAGIVGTLLLAGCGGGGGNSSSAPPVITSVNVSGSSYTQSGVCNNFTATVNGTGNYDHSVKWYVDDVVGGTPETGTITTSGNYCAPGQPPANNPVTIKAVANGDSTKSDTAATRVIAIQISPTQVQLYVGDTQQFSATIAGAANNSPVWMVNGKVGGDSTVGTVSVSGLYTAPAYVTDQAISVEVASADSNSVFATADARVSGKVSITPQNPQVPYQGTQQFTATMIGTNDTSVTWSARYGSINASGFYTATTTQSPDTITARSTHADGNTTVQITAPTPVITSLSPQPATAGQQITVIGQNFLPPLTAMFSDAAGGQIPVTVFNGNNGSFTITVPQGTVTGPFFVRSQPGGLPPVDSNIVTFQRLARLHIRTPHKDLSAGESVTLQYAFLGDSTSQAVTFSADLGSFSGATYLAPSTVASDSFVHITACITGTQSCDSLMLGLHPFRIAPDVPLVGLGQSLQLSAILGGGVTGANWDLLAGGGSLDSGGLYSAGTHLKDGGPAIVAATASGVTQQTQVGVTGAFPGLVNRVYDYVDQHDPNMEGTSPTGIAAIGNRLYVSASNHAGSYSDSYYWIDIYDISDPIHPIWLTAVEASSFGSIYSTGQYLFSYVFGDLGAPEGSGMITLYELKNGVPALKARSVIPQWWGIGVNQGVITVVPYQGSQTGSVEIQLYDLNSGVINSRDFTVTLPSDANQFLPDAAIAVGNRLFVSEIKNDVSQGGYIITYNLAVSPPQSLGTVAGRSLAFFGSQGNFLFGALGGMDTYDISNPLPEYLSHVDFINAWQLNGTKLLAITAQQGFSIVDMTNPAVPRVTGNLFDGVITGWDLSVMAGNYVYAAQADAGITVYDASQAGGPIYKAILYGGGFFWSESYDQHLRDPYVYAAAATSEGSTLNIYDTSTNPATRVGQVFDPSQQCYAVQSSGNNLYLGMDNVLRVFDLSSPAAPSFVRSVSLPVLSLERSGTILYAGTTDHRLVPVDISTPAQPKVLNGIFLTGPPVRIHAFGNLLLVADNTGGLFIFDISVPASPVLLKQVTGFTAVNDATLSGTTAFLAADVDGLAIMDLSNPSNPILLSTTSLSSIEPFSAGQPPNEALSLALHNGIVYVSTFFDNGLVMGFDYASPAAPRLVSQYAYGEFVLTTVDSMLFKGNDFFAGGFLGYTYSVQQMDLSNPYDSINQYFPPLALQNPGTLTAYRSPLPRETRARTANRHLSIQSADPHFSRMPIEKIPRRPLKTR